MQFCLVIKIAANIQSIFETSKYFEEYPLNVQCSMFNEPTATAYV